MYKSGMHKDKISQLVKFGKKMKMKVHFRKLDSSVILKIIMFMVAHLPVTTYIFQFMIRSAIIAIS